MRGPDALCGLARTPKRRESHGGPESHAARTAAASRTAPAKPRTACAGGKSWCGQVAAAKGFRAKMRAFSQF